MNKRGKILREPCIGPGLLMIEGRQYWFSLDRLCKSDVPTKPGLAVDVKLDHAGQILAITAVSDVLPEEQAQRSKAGVNLLRKIAAKCGIPNVLRR